MLAGAARVRARVMTCDVEAKAAAVRGARGGAQRERVRASGGWLAEGLLSLTACCCLAVDVLGRTLQKLSHASKEASIAAAAAAGAACYTYTAHSTGHSENILGVGFYASSRSFALTL